MMALACAQRCQSVAGFEAIADGKKFPRRVRPGWTWAWWLCVLGLLVVAGCERGGAGGGAGKSVVLYSSVDGEILRPIVDLYEQRTGVRVLLVGDTEATKTTGLVQRVIAERGRPGADVWWSSEILGTLRLAREGLLEPHKIGDESAWPEWLREPTGLWHAMALRPRVVVYRTGKHAELDAAPPRTIEDLLRPALKGRIGMARPAFGTTRGHVAVLRATMGAEGYEGLLRKLADHGLRLYDGNAAVVRAVANGEIDAALTDLDDVVAGRANGWPVASAAPGDGQPTLGVLTPNSLALVRGGPNTEAGRALLEYLLSPEVEKELAAGDWKAVPARAELRDAASQAWWVAMADVDWTRAGSEANDAIDAAERILGR